MSKGFASDTGSSHRWLAGLLGRSVGSLPSAGITRPRRYYEPVRPFASHRYSAPRGSATRRSPFASRRQVPTFRTRASRWSHDVFMTVAARPVGGFRRALSQANNWSLVLATSLRFRHVSNGSLAFV